MSAIRFLLKQLLKTDRSFALVPVCMRHIDKSLAQNNSDMASNGELRFLELIGKVFPAGTMFDIGANIGVWTSALLTRAPACTVHCFEPHPRTFAELQRRLQGDPRTTLHNFGLSDRTEQAVLYDVALDSGMSSLHKRESLATNGTVISQQPVTVSLTTVDAVVDRLGMNHIDLVKIDTEGNETRVLHGMSRTLGQKRVTMIQFEYGGTWIDSRTFLIDVWHLLEHYGFSLYKITPGGLASHSSYTLNLETFQYCNYVALLKNAMPLLEADS